MEVIRNIIENLVPIALFLGTFAMIFGIRYLSNIEQMAMIERGMQSNTGKSERSSFISLKLGLVLVGLGIGLLAALLVPQLNYFTRQESSVLYVGFLSMFGGVGLIISYATDKIWLDKHGKAK